MGTSLYQFGLHDNISMLFLPGLTTKKAGSEFTIGTVSLDAGADSEESVTASCG